VPPWWNLSAKTFFADVTASATARGGFEAFRLEWETQLGEAWPLAGLDIAGSRDFRIRVQATHVRDVAVADFYSDSYVARTTANREADDKVLIHLMRRGSWRFGRLNERGEAVTVPAGSFIVRHDGPPSLFEVDRGATARVLTLPASVLGPMIGDRQMVGSAGSAEIRLLAAHADMVAETAPILTPAGGQGARDALLELVKGVILQAFDDTEPRLASVLARAAMRMAENRLADPGLSPAALARELHVSVRTLHRAFTTAGESVTEYIRRRRLEQARLELTAIPGRPDISEVAARWQFADSSHFIRTFKKEYGQTPAQFARSAGPGSGNDGK
jgi:AraC family transcriptional activator of tynA and feaB